MTTAHDPAPGTPADAIAALTPRQRQVLELVARGRTNAEIGEALGITLDGAKWHVSEVISRLGVDTREEAAELWRQYNGLPARLRRVVEAVIGGGMLLRAGGAAAMLALLAGGAFLLAALLDDEAPGLTPDATETGTTAASPDLPSPTPEATSASPSTSEPTRRPAHEIDADGWPIADCPDGFREARFQDRPISACVPQDWTTVYWQDSTGGPVSYVASTLVMRSSAFLTGDGLAPHAVQLTVTATSSGPASHFQQSCVRPEPARLFDLPAKLCLGTKQDPNNLSFHSLESWYLEVSAQTVDYYITAHAVGPEVELHDVSEAVAFALAIIASAVHNGLDRLQ